MTSKTKVFRGLIDGHVAATQATVVFANAFLSQDELSRGYVGYPRSEMCHAVSADWKPTVRTRPGIALVDLADPDDSRWLSIPRVSNV
jgi:hypothetical protein